MERVAASSSPACAVSTLPPWAERPDGLQAAHVTDPRKLPAGGRNGRKTCGVVAAPVTAVGGICFCAGQLEEEDLSREAGRQQLRTERSLEKGMAKAKEEGRRQYLHVLLREGGCGRTPTSLGPACVQAG